MREGPVRPSLRELEVVRAVVEFGKTTAAAHSLGLSQPAVSRAIRALEERLGVLLFDRDGGRLQPTPAGIRLHRESAAVFGLLDAMAGAGQAPRRGELTLVAPPTFAQLFLHGMLAGFLARHPEVRLNVEVAPTADVVAQVAEGRADLGLSDTAPLHPAIVREPLRRARAHLVAPPGHALANLATVRPTDLADQPFIALTRRFHVRAELDRLLAANGIAPRIVAEVSTSVLASELVRAGVGVTLLNPFPISVAGGLVFRPFEPVLHYETCFLLPASQPAGDLARAFIAHARREQPEDGLTTALR